MQLICRSEIISVLTMIQKYVVNWYYTHLLNTRMDCTEATIVQHYYWNNLREENLDPR